MRQVLCVYRDVQLLRPVTGPLPAPGYPDTGGRCYMTNEQLSWLTPFSQQVATGFAWRPKSFSNRENTLPQDVPALNFC